MLRCCLVNNVADEALFLNGRHCLSMQISLISKQPFGSVHLYCDSGMYTHSYEP